jgi:hypothetical protein
LLAKRQLSGSLQRELELSFLFVGLLLKQFVDGVDKTGVAVLRGHNKARLALVVGCAEIGGGVPEDELHEIGREQVGLCQGRPQQRPAVLVPRHIIEA